MKFGNLDAHCGVHVPRTVNYSVGRSVQVGGFDILSLRKIQYMLADNHRAQIDFSQPTATYLRSRSRLRSRLPRS